jgi:hypothetical protein
MSKETKTEKTTSLAAVPEDNRQGGLIVSPRHDLDRLSIDAMTGEEVPDIIRAMISGTDNGKWKTISVNGYIAPLAGNIVVGRSLRMIDIGSQYSKPGEPPRTGAIVEGYAWQFLEDPSLYTKSKTDPPYDETKWGVTSGTYIVPTMSFSQRLADAVGSVIRVIYGPYLKGARNRKIAILEILGENDAKKIEGYLNAI